MELLDWLSVQHADGERRIELYHGDLTAMPEAVDLLIVSAFPNHYAPERGTLIEALHKRGISVAHLATERAADLREDFGCWLSQPITADAMPFKRLLCFEPRTRGAPAEVIGDLFQALIAIISHEPSLRTVAMSMVATGRQGVPIADILEPLLEAAAHWLAMGLGVNCLKIVEFVDRKAYELKGAFAILKKHYAEMNMSMSPQYRYDLFISYASPNRPDVLRVVDYLQVQKPDLRIFFDRRELTLGDAWQQQIFEALDDCNKVVAFYSPAYLASKVCKEEFNIALFRHRETGATLLPIYLYSAALPTYMKLIQFTDCREADTAKLHAAAESILAAVSRGWKDTNC